MKRPAPDLSVVIPTYNRADQLVSCLDSLAAQDLDSDRFEVIVVIDGSTDDTETQLGRMQPRYRLHVASQENAGPGAARNTGVRVARGRICVFIDDDILADPKLLSAHLGAHRSSREVIALGSVTIELKRPSDSLARYFAEWYTEHDTKLARGERKPTYMDCYSNNMSISVKLFHRLGGFAEDLPRSEDVELGYRAFEAGVPFIFVQTARARSRYEKGSRQIRRLAFKEGAAAVELHRRHPPMLAQMPLGDFCGGRTRRMLACRLVTTLRVPLSVLGAIGRVLPGELGQDWPRFGYESAYWRGVRRSVDRDHWRRLTWGTQILMFHALGHGHEPPSRYVLPSTRFALHMRWLRLARRRVLSLAEYASCRNEFRLPPARTVVLTFDDGYNDNYELAFPILRRHHYSATIFLVTESIGERNDWVPDGPLAGRPLLSWKQIEEMARHGIGYGAHTRQHVRLPSLSADAAQVEVAGSRAVLEEHLATPTQLFAYPHGAVDDDSRELVARAGFEVACGTSSGTNTFATPRFDLRRVEIEGTDTLLRFALKAWTGEHQLLRWARRS